MIVQVSEILKDVRVCIDENMQSTKLITEDDVDTLALDDIIRSKIIDAVRLVEEQAPVHLLENGHSFAGEDGDDIYWERDHSGWVLLPDDFMRLICFEMSDWERPVYAAIGPDDSEYLLQRSSIRGVRGNWQRPVCAITTRPEGKALEFYSCKSDDAIISRAVYLPYPFIDNLGGVDLSEKCYRSIVYMCAGLTLASAGNDDKGTSMMNLSKNMIGTE